MNFFVDLVTPSSLIITLPEKFLIEDLYDMKVSENSSIYFKFQDEEYTLTITDKEVIEFLSNMKEIEDRRILITDIEEVKKKQNSISLIYS